MACLFDLAVTTPADYRAELLSVIHSSARVMINMEEGVIAMVCRCEMGSLGHLRG